MKSLTKQAYDAVDTCNSIASAQGYKLNDRKCTEVAYGCQIIDRLVEEFDIEDSGINIDIDCFCVKIFFICPSITVTDEEQSLIYKVVENADRMNIVSDESKSKIIVTLFFNNVWEM